MTPPVLSSCPACHRRLSVLPFSPRSRFFYPLPASSPLPVHAPLTPSPASTAAGTLPFGLFHLCPPEPVPVAADKVTGNLRRCPHCSSGPEPSRIKSLLGLAPATFPARFPVSSLVSECTRLAPKSRPLFSLTGSPCSLLLLATCVTRALIPLPVVRLPTLPFCYNHTHAQTSPTFFILSLYDTRLCRLPINLGLCILTSISI